MTWISKLAVTVLLLGLFGATRPAPAQESLDVERIQRATVFLMQATSTGQDLLVHCVGSGTVVSRNGLILTNAHIVQQGQNCPGDTIIIALSVRLNQPPVPTYLAEIVQADTGLDLALIRVSRQIDGRLVNPDAIALPFVELGDSAAVNLDDTIAVFGYGGLGEDPVQIERGTVTGFAAEPSGGDKSWIKTGAVIRGTMSGGGAYNQLGQLIGIPTTAPVSANEPSSTCIVLQDTNRDGLVNTADACVPVGSFINSLRPSNFAQPLLRAAQLGLDVEQITAPPITTAPTGQPTVRYLGFSASVNDAGMPTSIISTLPTGSDSLYLFFDYANMTPETVYELRVNTNGVPNPTFSLSPVRWSGSRDGLWYVGSSGQPFPNGVYDFTLFVNGIAGGNARLVVGEPPPPGGEFSDIVFGLLDEQGNVLGNGFVLPTGSIASARFLYRNMTAGTPWTAIWYYDGVEIQRTPDDTVWQEADGANGVKTISIQDPNGLLPGNYRLELYLQGRLAALSNFTMAGAQAAGQFARIFTNLRYTSAATAEEARTAASITSFTSGIPQLFTLFDWEQIAPGTPWQLVWTVDGNPFYTQSEPWSAPETGQGFTFMLSGANGIPDGTYGITLSINRLPFATAEARVGIGQLPIDIFAQAGGIVMRGRVVDALTGQGIPGVAVLLINENFSVSEFTRDWLQAQLHAQSITDRNGRFEISRTLERDAPYSIVFIKEGYLPVTADGVELNEETKPDNDPIELTVELSRDTP
jgi:S1-C subfamily serine protease